MLQEKGFTNQYADGFIVLHPGKTMVGRVFTAQFMLVREDVEAVAKKKAMDRGIPRLSQIRQRLICFSSETFWLWTYSGKRSTEPSLATICFIT